MAQTTETRLPQSAGRSFSFRSLWDWVGVLPFFIFIFVFLIIPSTSLFVGAFQDGHGNFTLDNITGLFSPYIIKAYRTSLQVSLITSVVGGVFGFFVAYAITMGHAPRWMRNVLMTFSGLAANFGGVPLAFAFIATVGQTGFITAAFRLAGINIYNLSRSSAGVKQVIDNLNQFIAPPIDFVASLVCQPIHIFGFQIALCQYSDFNLYEFQFSLYSLLGLTLAYTYFQFPLMVLIITPALDGLKREWREASENLGATAWQYWWHVGLPILWPSILGATILLFGSAFGAYATAQALTSGSIPLVTIVIGQQIRGDVLGNANLGYALALGMVIIMAVSIIGYTLLQRRTTRWLKS